MSQNSNNGFDPSDPLGAWRSLRDANLDAWARGMTSLVSTEAFAQAIGMQLDSILAASAPLQKAFQQSMETYLAQANMPSRAEVLSLAQRMTNIELRLDDMQAQLDDLLTAVRALAPASAPATAPAEPQPLPAPMPAAPAPRRRARKPAPKQP